MDVSTGLLAGMDRDSEPAFWKGAGACTYFGRFMLLVAHFDRKPNRPPECNFGKGVKMYSVQTRDDTIAAKIGAQLRVMYDDVLREPLPDNISKLMERLETGKVVPLPIVQQFKANIISLRTADLSKAADNYNRSARRRAKRG
jgi:hypothetical protein